MLSRHASARPVMLLATGLLLTVVVLAHTYLVMKVQGLPTSRLIMVVSALHGLSLIAMTPAASALAMRYPLEVSNWGRHLLVHLAAMLALHAVIVLGMILIAGTLAPLGMPFRSAYVSTWLSSFLFFLLLYAVVVAAVHALGHAARAQERTVHAAQLESQLVHAQLEALRVQLNPHFLFNTLHAVSALMGRDVGAARTMLSDLSELLRLSLDRVGEHEVTLEDELVFLEHYLQIEQTRFRDRLRVDRRITPDARQALVPSLLLQPLVENAIKHGVAPRGEGGNVTISARHEGSHLVLVVADDGPGLPAGVTSAPGIGLRNTRERLAKLYGNEHALSMENRPEGGAAVVVRIPSHTVAGDLPR